MKKNIVKLFASLSLGLVVLLPLSTITSCKAVYFGEQEDTNELNEHFKYISDRTFSIASVLNNPLENKKQYVNGTVWVYKRHSVTNNDVYRYTMVSNFHVVAGFFEQWFIASKLGEDKAKQIYSINYLFNNYNLDDDPSTPERAYHQVAGFYNDIHYWEFDQLRPTWRTPMIPSSDPKKIFCDLCFFDIDFTRTVKSGQRRLQQKLDELNRQADYNGIITKFAQIKEDTIKVGEQLYVGGYPWEPAGKKEPNTSSRGYTYFTQYKFKVGNIERSELVDLGDDVPYKTKQDQFYPIKDQETTGEGVVKSWELGPGGSGSMVINQKKEVVGVYWGGVIPDASSNGVWIPKFALFYYKEFNFSWLEKYENNELPEIPENPENW